MNIRIPKLSLGVLVGPSGSGKSTFARKHFLPTEGAVVRQQRSQLRRSLKALKREGFRHIFVMDSVEEIEAATIERVPLWNDKRDERGPFDIKLVKCGGLTPAREMIARARQLGLRVMVGCMTESTVGISAIAQLLPLLDYVDMDGALLLAEDIASGVSVEQGQCRYPDEAGNGVRLLRAGKHLW